MTEHATQPTGLYALKPWYAGQLAGVLRWCRDHRITPGQVTLAGIGFGALAGTALALLPAGAAALACVPLLALRLAAANLDGGLARARGLSSPWGAVLNEVGDRAAELAVLAGCFWLAPAWLVLAAMLAATLPSWVALAGAAAGLGRMNGGPVGKTERCLLLAVLAAVPGAAFAVLLMLAAGSVLTAVLRLARLRVVAAR